MAGLINRAGLPLGTSQGRPQLPPRWGRFFVTTGHRKSRRHWRTAARRVRKL